MPLHYNELKLKSWSKRNASRDADETLTYAVGIANSVYAAPHRLGMRGHRA